MVKGIKPDTDFSKAHHFGFTYDWNINQSLHLKIDPIINTCSTYRWKRILPFRLLITKNST